MSNVWFCVLPYDTALPATPTCTLDLMLSGYTVIHVISGLPWDNLAVLIHVYITSSLVENVLY